MLRDSSAGNWTTHSSRQISQDWLAQEQRFLATSRISHTTFFPQGLTAHCIPHRATSKFGQLKITNRILIYHRWVVLIGGIGVITLPDNSSTTFTTNGGEFGLLFATDTADVSEEGHGGIFPGPTETIFLQIPTKNNEIPKHRVLKEDEPCTVNEVEGLRSWALPAEAGP